MTEILESLQFVYGPQVANGLAIGVAVILMALGLTIIFGLLDVINMSHGEFYALGAYLAVTMVGKGVNFWLCLAMVPVLMAAIGYVTERALIQRVFHTKDRHILTLLLTMVTAGYLLVHYLPAGVGFTDALHVADRMVRGPGWGGWLFRQLTRPGVIRYFLRRTWGRREIDEALWAYACLTTRQPGAEHAPLSFLSAGLFAADIHRVYGRLGVPVLVVHGTRGDFTDYRALPTVSAGRGWRVHVMRDAGALPYFERPDEFMAVYRGFLGEAQPR